MGNTALKERVSQKQSESCYVRHHIMYHEPTNVTLFLTPKAGNTSLKKSILEGLGFDLNYEYPAGFKFVSPEIALKLKREHGAHSIGFVRHPTQRYVSWWSDKIRPPNIHRLHEIFVEFLNIVEEVQLSEGWDAVNMHGRLMSHEMSFDGQFIPDTIFKFEEFTEKGWDEVAAEFEKHMNITLEPLPHLNKSQEVPAFSEDIRKRIEALYSEDYDCFNYKRSCDE